MISHRNYWTVTARQISKRGWDMASIIENLITELNDEYALYEQLLQVSMEKTGYLSNTGLGKSKRKSPGLKNRQQKNT